MYFGIHHVQRGRHLLKTELFVRPAMHAFIDTEIIAKAPAQYMWAGIGDTYAKYYEATISSRGEQLEHFTSLGVALSVMCRNPLLEYGAKALEDHKKDYVPTMWSRLSLPSS